VFRCCFSFCEFLFFRLVACVFASNECILGDPAANEDLPGCCWYSENTCCAADMDDYTELSVLLVESIYDDVTDGGANTNHTIEKCLSYLDSFMCLACDPNLSTFIAIDTSGDGSVTINLCESFCDDMYSACSDDSLVEINAFLGASGITNGKELCLSFNGFDFGEDDKSTERLMQSFSRKIRDDPVEPVFAFGVKSSDCFVGASINDISTSTCTPWKGDYSASSFWWYWVFFVLGFFVCCAVIIVVGVVAGVLIWRKKQASVVINSGGDYPNLEELDE